MSIAHIVPDATNGEDAADIVNAVVDAVNDPVPDAISLTGDPTGLDITLSQSRVYRGDQVFAGLTLTDASGAVSGVLTLDLGAAEIYRNANNAILSQFTGLTALDLGSIVAMFGEWGATYPSLTSLTADNFAYLSGNLTATFSVLETLSLPAYVAGDIGFSGDILTTLSLPLWENDHAVGFQPYAPLLATIDLPSVKHIDGGCIPFTPELVTFSFGSGLLSMSECTITGAKLNQASVNGILVSLAALDGTGGTTLYENQTVDLSGGTSASPSGAGLTAKATLEGRGCTVTVN